MRNTYDFPLVFAVVSDRGIVGHWAMWLYVLSFRAHSNNGWLLLSFEKNYFSLQISRMGSNLNETFSVDEVYTWLNDNGFQEFSEAFKDMYLIIILIARVYNTWQWSMDGSHFMFIS